MALGRIDTFDIRAAQPVRPGLGAGLGVEQGEAREIGGSPNAIALDPDRRGDVPHPVVQKVMYHDAPPTPRRRVESDGHVDAVLGSHLDAGMGAAEGVEPRDQPAHHEGGEA